MTGVVRFGAGSLAELGEVLDEVGIERALLVATRRGAHSVSGLPVVGVYDGVEPHVPAATVQACAALALELGVDGLVGLGGGSAVDTCKAVAAELAASSANPPRVVAVPTTYAGAEWTSFFGVLQEPGRKGGGSDPRSRPVAAVYDPALTLELPLGATVGTALNALAHCAEAYYHPATGEAASLEADAGAAAIAEALPRVVEQPASLGGRTRLLEGAMHAALALGLSGLCLAHAMAQGLGGRYALPQGAMNALCLPAALRFNAEAVPEEVARFTAALGSEDGPTRCEELARLGGFERLRQYAVEEADLGGVAEEIAGRPGARANPRPAPAAEIERLLLEIW